MPTTLGTDSKTTFFNVESHKLMLEFVAAEAIKFAQPVVLDAATGKVKAATASSTPGLIIGYAIIESKVDGDLITVVMKAFMHIRAGAAAAINAGPVKWSAYDATNLVNQYVAAADDATTQGWCLTKTTAASTEIYVVLR